MQTILLANPRGFCAGVERAIAVDVRDVAHFSLAEVLDEDAEVEDTYAPIVIEVAG